MNGNSNEECESGIEQPKQPLERFMELLKIIPSTQQQQSNSADFGNKDDDESKPEAFLDGELYSTICEVIEEMEAKEFEEFQEGLLQYTVFEWPKQSCYSFSTISFISKLFAFITKIASREIADEYVYLFSRPNTPPQLKYFIYPAVLRQSQLKSEGIVRKLADFELIHIFTKLTFDARNDRYYDFLKSFWQRVGQNWNDELVPLLLPICSSMVYALPSLEFETVTLVVSTVHQNFLKDPITPDQVLNTAVLLIGFQRLSWQNSEAWQNLEDIISKLVRHCLKSNRSTSIVIVNNFAMECVASFLDKVDVEFGEMTERLVRLVRREVKRAEQETVPPPPPECHPEKLVKNHLTDNNNPPTNTVAIEAASSKKNPSKCLDMFEKVLGKMRGHEFLFSEDERTRLNVIIEELKNF